MTARALLYAASRSQDEFVLRAVRYLAAQVGMCQFLDVGSGIAADTTLHAVLQEVFPAAQVFYVTDDAAFLAAAHEAPDGPGRRSVDHREGDIRDPAAVLEHAAAGLDLDLPVAVVLTGVLHLLVDTDDPTGAYGIVSRVVDAVASDSHVVISHLADDIQPREMAAIERQVNDESDETWQFRDREEVGQLFTGLDLVEPGVVQADQWRPAIDPPPVPPQGLAMSAVWAGVGRKQ